jgi:tetratricopeptide (TPR) repeat protein
MNTDKIFDKILGSLSAWVNEYYTNHKKVQKDLKNIITKYKHILELDKGGKSHENECKELINLLTESQGQLNLRLHPIEEKDRAMREKLLTTLNSSKSHLESEITVTYNIIDELLKQLEDVRKEIHLLNPLLDKAKKITKVQLLFFGVPTIFSLAALSFLAYDRTYILPAMQKDCNETPWHRSNEWLSGQLPPYRSFVEESHTISGNTCISSYNKKKVDRDLDVSGKVFSKLKLIDEKNIQATFFLEYISKARKSTSTEYNESISLAKKYVNDIKSENYILRKEDFDIVVKIAHILEGKQDYDTAYKLYNFILGQKGNDKHLNALLGICTTHIKTKTQKESISSILENCKDSVEILKKQDPIENDNKFKRQAIAHYNFGCLLLRTKKYSDAEKQFVLGEELDGNNLNMKRAVFFSKLLNKDYEGARKFISDVISESDEDITDPSSPNKKFYNDMQMGLGIAYLGLADSSDNEKEKLDHYKKAYINIENSRNVLIGTMYLPKIENCKNVIGKECSAIRPFKSNKEDEPLLNHLHDKFWAFINHYNMSKNIADAKVRIDVGDDGKLKGNACSILTK